MGRRRDAPAIYSIPGGIDMVALLPRKEIEIPACLIALNQERKRLAIAGEVSPR